MKIWKLFQTSPVIVKNKIVKSEQFIENCQSVKTTRIVNQQNIATKDAPQISNLSKRQLNKFKISLLPKRPKFCPTAK